MGDSMGVLLFTPVLLTIKEWHLEHWDRKRIAELGVVIFGVALTSVASLTDFFGFSHGTKIATAEAFFYFIFVSVI